VAVKLERKVTAGDQRT